MNNKNFLLEKLLLEISDLIANTNNIEDVKNRVLLKYSNLFKMVENGSPVYICGARQLGTEIGCKMKELKYNIVGFIDRDPCLHGKVIAGLPIVPYEEINDGKDTVFIISSSLFCGDMYSLLSERNCKYIMPYWVLDILDILDLSIFINSSKEYYYGFIEDLLRNKSGYLNLLNILANNESKITLAKHILFRLTLDISFLKDICSSSEQYFEKGIINLSESECFVDAGGYTGDTLQVFLEKTENNFKKYYLFEPDEDLMKIACRQSDDKRIIYESYGLFSENGVLKFDKTGDMGGAITNRGSSSIRVCTLDSKVMEKITFFKLDIEGAELNALKGAERQIVESKPTIAVSVYHKPNDLISISEYILQKVSGYKLYLYCYLNSIYEIILYAIYED
jgi:FkbM family methyltransferase